MTTKTLILGALFEAILFGGGAAAVGDSSGTQPEVLVRIHNSDEVPPRMMVTAKNRATEILAGAGVRTRWASSRSSVQTASADEVIDLQFVYSSREHSVSKALAEAFPFASSGVRVIVYYDRVKDVLQSRLAPDGFVLGHVMAHEIGHVLLKMHNHSTTGLMKAHWTDHDFVEMRWKCLEFTPEAAATIRRNLRVDHALTARLLADAGH